MYVESDALLLADVFENFRNMCLKIYELNPVCLLTAPGLGWQAALNKKKKSKIRSFNWYRYVINARKRYYKENITLFIDMQKLKMHEKLW